MKRALVWLGSDTILRRTGNLKRSFSSDACFGRRANLTRFNDFRGQ